MLMGVEQKCIGSLGLLEFAEKQKPSDTVTRTVRSIPTQLTANVDDPDM